MPESHPLVHGMVDMYGRKSGIWGLLECDVMIGVGCRFTDRITGRPGSFARGTTLVHVDIDACELGKNLPAAVRVQADARAGAEALLVATATDLIRMLVDPRIDNAPMMPAGTELADYHSHCVAEPGTPFDAAERRAIEETTP